MPSVNVDLGDVLWDCTEREIGEELRRHSGLPAILKVIGKERLVEAMSKMESGDKMDDDDDPGATFESSVEKFAGFGYTGEELYRRAFQHAYGRNMKSFVSL